ncbi:hypothetical protein DSO57_1024173 [Entomophthora muscae]|uniref:Uncharacterized protein n=1 Tax=Entomophthora muscae TaxID=34485 RepID=A0ACC2S4P6_9FUNG|nr:hypothetical protein DSO57_1024173 [Entomophthora muscae]
MRGETGEVWRIRDKKKGKQKPVLYADLQGKTGEAATTQAGVLKLSALDLVLATPPSLIPPVSLPPEDPVGWAPEEGSVTQEPAPKRALWLLGGMILMGLDSYFPQFSGASSLGDATLSGHPSCELDGALVDPFPRMGAKLSLVPLSHTKADF